MVGRAWVVLMASLIFGVVAISAALYVITSRLWGFTFPGIFLSLALVATAVITFFGFLWHGIGEDRRLDDADMRTAITVSVVTVYLVLVGLVAFIPEQTPGGQSPTITNTMLTSFTAIVGVVVPFYFGASAYVYIQRYRADRSIGIDSARE
jgi:hypothetical protein